MGKLWVEICLISARGLRRTFSLFKLQWYAVGWIDSENKYRTRVDTCAKTNPAWKTKFSALIDDVETKSENLALQVEVYSRDPIFLRERLQGTTTIFLKEFFDKFQKNSEGYKPFEEIGSFQLRKKDSNKPQGFVDVSIRVSKEIEDPNIYTGDNEGIKLIDYNNHINPLTNQYGPPQASQPFFSPPPFHIPENRPPPINPAYSSTYSNTLQAGPSYPLASRPSYTPTFLPGNDNNYHNIQPSYMSMPPGGAGRGGRAGFGIGLGAGALAAGAVISGDDFMSTSGLCNPTLTLATDPPIW